MNFPSKLGIPKSMRCECTLVVRYRSPYSARLSYIRNLHDYLLSFLKRTQPLVDIDSKHQEDEAEFQKKWEAGEFDADWEDQSSKRVPSQEAGGVWCSACELLIRWRYAYIHSIDHRSKKLLQANGVRRTFDLEKACQGDR